MILRKYAVLFDTAFSYSSLSIQAVEMVFLSKLHEQTSFLKEGMIFEPFRKKIVFFLRKHPICLLSIVLTNLPKTSGKLKLRQRTRACGPICSVEM